MRRSLRKLLDFEFERIVFAQLVAFGAAAGMGAIYHCAMPLIAAALIYEHRSAGALDVTAINRAFFPSNAFVSAIFLLAVTIDVVSHH